VFHPRYVILYFITSISRPLTVSSAYRVMNCHIFQCCVPLMLIVSIKANQLCTLNLAYPKYFILSPTFFSPDGLLSRILIQNK